MNAVLKKLVCTVSQQVKKKKSTQTNPVLLQQVRKE